MCNQDTVVGERERDGGGGGGGVSRTIPLQNLRISCSLHTTQEQSIQGDPGLILSIESGDKDLKIGQRNNIYSGTTGGNDITWQHPTITSVNNG